MYKEYVEYLAKLLVTQPEQVVVETSEGPTGIVVKVRVAPDDVGRVIGKQGRTAHAMRALLHAMAARHGQRVMLQMID